ncbi:MAG: CHAD domain-containing protein [Hyphomicrobiaceae bacterium]
MQYEQREIELKLELTGEELERIRAKRILRELTVGRPVIRTLRSIYFDTPDHALRNARMSLRVRRVANSWLQTAKAETGVRFGLSKPIEVETYVSGPHPDLDIPAQQAVLGRIKALIGDQALMRVFETVVRRTTRQLHGRCGSRIEMALDHGTISANGNSSNICEVELELKSGETSALYDLVDELFSGESVRFSTSSKAERGYRVASGEAPHTVKPKFSTNPALQKSHTIAKAFERSFRVAAQQVLGNWPVVLESNDPEGVHQFRIGLRRLRSLLRAYRPYTKSLSAQQLSDEARDLARLLSDLRDTDVLIKDIVDTAAKIYDHETGFEALRDMLISRTADDRARARRTLTENRWSSFQIRLAMFAEEPSQLLAEKARKKLKKPIAGHSPKALQRSWDNIVLWGRDIEQLSIKERHEMRKALKTLRYTCEFFAPIYPQKSRQAFVRQIKLLQDIFGYLNDVAVAERLKDMTAEQANNSPEVQRAVGFLHGWHYAQSHNAWTKARTRWKKLEKFPKFWASP